MLIRRAIRKALQVLIPRATVTSHVEGSISIVVAKSVIDTMDNLKAKVAGVLNGLEAGTLKVLKSSETETLLSLYFTSESLVPAFNGVQHTSLHRERLEGKLAQAEAEQAQVASLAQITEAGEPPITVEPQQQPRQGRRGRGRQVVVPASTEE